jgi:hypothetical protein
MISTEHIHVQCVGYAIGLGAFQWRSWTLYSAVSTNTWKLCISPRISLGYHLINIDTTNIPSHRRL